MSSSIDKPIIVWLFTGCTLIFLMVVVGGITRLTQSGLSIVEWNLLMGTFPPLTELAWQDLFLKYQQSPQFQLVNTHFSLHEFKSIFWWEYIHRLFGRFIGLVFFIPFVYFLVTKKFNVTLLKKLLLIFVLGGFQGFLGWYMVKSGLVKDPAVSHYRLAAHLITAFISFGFTFWVALDLLPKEKKQQSDFSPLLYTLSLLLFLVLTIQIIYGAFVAGLKAGYSYTTFPKMGDQWIAESVGYTYNKMGLMSFFENPASVQFIHRYIAYGVVALIGIIWYVGWKNAVNGNLKRSIDLLVSLVSLQFLLGIITLIYSVPVVFGVLHQAGAFFTFGAVIYLFFQLSLSKQNYSKG
ncbi:MAG: COX15/CtaA family protein [Bacteroidetes bacterium]|nr:COX15/CtaA family protein [Bacteroidota bacterium]HET6244186.1 COX15/CtaA family protein [Bacteroidia bacterium]